MKLSLFNWRPCAAMIMLLACSTQTHAFYWQNWPGSRIRTEPTLIGPPHTHIPGNPPRGPHTHPPSPDYPDVPTDQPPLPLGPPEVTPEPASGLLGVLGLCVLGGVRKLRKRGA